MLNNLALLAIGVAIIFTLSHGRDDLEADRDNYCEMHALYQATGGESGWPDYRGTFEDECK